MQARQPLTPSAELIDANAADHRGGTTGLRKLIWQGLLTYDHASTEEAARLMGGHKRRRVSVLNQHAELVGMASLADLPRSGGEAGGMARDALASVAEPPLHPRRT